MYVKHVHDEHRLYNYAICNDLLMSYRLCGGVVFIFSITYCYDTFLVYYIPTKFSTFCTCSEKMTALTFVIRVVVAKDIEMPCVYLQHTLWIQLPVYPFHGSYRWRRWGEAVLLILIPSKQWRTKFFLVDLEYLLIKNN